MQATLEIKYKPDSKWVAWNNESSTICVDYGDSRLLCLDDLFRKHTITPKLSHAPIISIDTVPIWDYRISGAQSFRERLGLNDCRK